MKQITYYFVPSLNLGNSKHLRQNDPAPELAMMLELDSDVVLVENLAARLIDDDGRGPLAPWLSGLGFDSITNV